MEYRLQYILTGASGSGKTTMAHILEQYGLQRCITHTTRPPRAGETNGKDYYFVSHIDPREMFERTTFGNHQYGVSREELSRGDFIILDPQGVDYYRKHFPGKLTVIQLVRDNIQVDAHRMARDRAAGFDRIHPDLVVHGNTIEEMAENLLNALRQCTSHLQAKLTFLPSQTIEPPNSREIKHTPCVSGFTVHTP